MNKYILIFIITWLVTQTLKVVIESFQNKKINLKRFINGSGGMPSSHTGLVVSFSTTAFLLEGFESSIFAFSFLLAIIVIYDATHVRYDVGEHAKILNTNFNTKFNILVGHTKYEVLGGILVGLIVPVILLKLL